MKTKHERWFSVWWIPRPRPKGVFPQNALNLEKAWARSWRLEPWDVTLKGRLRVFPRFMQSVCLIALLPWLMPGGSVIALVLMQDCSGFLDEIYITLHQGLRSFVWQQILQIEYIIKRNTLKGVHHYLWLWNWIIKTNLIATFVLHRRTRVVAVVASKCVFVDCLCCAGLNCLFVVSLKAFNVLILMILMILILIIIILIRLILILNDTR